MRDQSVGHPVGEVVLSRIPGKVDEWEHRQRPDRGGNAWAREPIANLGQIQADDCGDEESGCG